MRIPLFDEAIPIPLLPLAKTGPDVSSTATPNTMYSGTGVIRDTNRANFVREVYPDLTPPRVRKQKIIDTARKNSDDILGGSRGAKPFAMREASNAGIGTTSMKQASELELEEINGLSHETLVDSRTLRAQVVALCESISGDGEVLPPMIILPCVLHLEQWYTSTGLEDNVFVAVSETGYSNDELSLGWLRLFERYSARRQLGTYRLPNTHWHSAITDINAAVCAIP